MNEHSRISKDVMSLFKMLFKDIRFFKMSKFSCTIIPLFINKYQYSITKKILNKNYILYMPKLANN